MVETISTSPIQQGNAANKKVPIIVAIVLIAALIGGIVYLRQPKKTEEKVTTITSTPAPSPTEKPKIDKQTVKIQVQNGTGTPGQAGTAVTAITKAGYTADNIKTGNAEEYNHTKTTISVKKGFEEVATDLKSSLEETFTDIEIESTPLDGANEFDVVVITGGKLFTTTAPTKAAAPTGSTTKTPTPTGTATTASPSPSPSPSPTQTP